MSDAARRAEAVRDGIAGVTPSDGQVAEILARTAEAPLLPLGDQIFQRRRFIWERQGRHWV